MGDDHELTGGCHCGAIRYSMRRPVAHHALCHCADCRRSSGAPAVAWAMVPRDSVTVTAGEPIVYQSSQNAQRSFCGVCGTGLFYVNDTMLPGMIDIQSATLDDPGVLVLESQIQTAERIGWMKTIEDLPSFERYPGQD